ncbi:glycosyltransferase family 2 protein, partial [Escherichia coli]|nr:glycosyltransferase family 2 protein [Escherichia coli]
NYRTCVSLATQDIMVILGCDDIMLPNYVDTILAAHTKFPDAAIIQPGVQVIDENSQLVETIADRVKQSVVKPKIDSTTALHGNRL